MILDYATGPKVFRLRATPTEDSYGDPVDGWDAPASKRLIGADVQPVGGSASSEKETPSADEIENVRNLFVPGAADLTSADRIQLGAEIWRVDGDPVTRAGLALGVYTQARLRRHEGR